MIQLKKKFTFQSATLSMILFTCLSMTLLQGIPSLQALPRYLKMNVFLLLIAITLGTVAVLKKRGKLTEERAVFAILFIGMLVHSSYVALSGLYERQHDEGVYTGIADTHINPGHIGYIEYIYKFRRLPDIHPYQLFSYYHPPLHYLLSGIWLVFLTSLGMWENLAFENLQILPLLYSGLFMLVTYRILKCTGGSGKTLYGGMILTALHPALMFMSGSVNNDMLSNLLLALCIWAVLTWLKSRTLKNLLFIGAVTGLGMLCKLNTAVITFPIGLLFLIDLIRIFSQKDKLKIKKAVAHYAAFLVVCGGIGLSFILRNLILFQVKPGISSATPASVMYTGDYSLWARLGIPALSDLQFSFPFHPLNGDTIHNIWVILFQTSLFAEVFPADLRNGPLLLCQVIYILGIAAALSSAVLFAAVQIKKLKSASYGDEALFLLSGYFIFLFSFIAFSVKYPYTCSSDFRYIVICLVFVASGLSESQKLFPANTKGGRLCRLVNTGVIALTALSTVLFMVWRQW